MFELGINLIPWREARRSKKKRQNYLILSALFAIIWFLILSEKNYLLEMKGIEEQDYYQLKKNLNELDEALQDKRKNKQLKLKEKLIKNRIKKEVADIKGLIYFLDKIVDIIPNDTLLQQIEKHNKKILLTGYADSEIGIAAFLKAIKKEVNRIEILEIKKIGTKENKNKNEFKFNIPLKHLNLISNEKLYK